MTKRTIENAKQKKSSAKSEPIVVAQIMGKWLGGGVEAVIMNYYRHIDRTKVQFDFICDEDSTNIPYEEIEKLGGKVILCPPYQKLPKYLKFLKQLFKEKKYRIVHSNINTLSVFPLYAAKKAGVPVRIAHSHSTSNPREWKKNLLKNALRPFSKKYATDYFACSELAGRYLFGDKAFNKGEVKIIRNAIDVEKFKFDPEARKQLRKEIGIKDIDFVIGHIGRFMKQKNHSFLIDIFAEVKKEKPNAKLVLAGQGPLREEIENKVKELGLEKDVFFLGQRSDSNKLYSLFDVFCLPSLYEGLPVVGVEAQANGVPCYFSNQISEETFITNLAKSININASPKEVAKSLLSSAPRTIDKKIDAYDIANNCSRIYRKLDGTRKESSIKHYLKEKRLQLNRVGSKARAKQIEGKEPTILANNCYAGIVSQYLGIKYYTPTVGLYFFAPEYIKFLKNLDHYLNGNIVFISYLDSKYRDFLLERGQTFCPIGKIDDVEIVFLHYKTEDEVVKKWNERKKRINKDRLIVKFSEQNLCERSSIEEFAKLPYKNKLLFVANKYDNIRGAYQIKKDEKNGEIQKDYYDSHKYVNLVSYIQKMVKNREN